MSCNDDNDQKDDKDGGRTGGETLKTKERCSREQGMALELEQGKTGMHNGARTVWVGW